MFREKLNSSVPVSSSISLISSLSESVEESVKFVAKLESPIHEIERGLIAKFNLLDYSHRLEIEQLIVQLRDGTKSDSKFNRKYVSCYNADLYNGKERT